MVLGVDDEAPLVSPGIINPAKLAEASKNSLRFTCTPRSVVSSPSKAVPSKFRTGMGVVARICRRTNLPQSDEFIRPSGNLPKLGLQFNMVNYGTFNLSGMLVENPACSKTVSFRQAA